MLHTATAFPGTSTWNKVIAKANDTHGFIKRNDKTKNKTVRETAYKHMFVSSWRVLPKFGTPLDEKRYSGLGKFNIGLYGVSRVITNTATLVGVFIFTLFCLESPVNEQY